MNRQREIHNLVRIHPRPETEYVAQGRTVFATGLDGFVSEGHFEGLWAFDTRLLSKYRWLVDGRRPIPVVVSNVEMHNSLGYYVALPGDVPRESADMGSGMVEEVSERTLELRIARFVGHGVHEDIDLENFTGLPLKFTLVLEVAADFADPHEAGRQRRQQGNVTEEWETFNEAVWELHFDYRATHQYSHQGNEGTAHLHRGVTLRFHHSGSPAQHRPGHVSFSVELPPHGTWHTCLDLIPLIDGNLLEPAYGCYAFYSRDTELDRRRQIFLAEAAKFEAPGSADLTHTVMTALTQAKRDLATLRLVDLDRGERAWVPAAGLPLYLALFGRDTLTAAWQTAPVSPDLMRGTLPELARWQGTEVNDWRDEQPGRMLHEAHAGPLAILQFNPRNRYYGAATTSVFYGFVLSELWHWTGDREVVAPLIGPALDALKWADQNALREDGFYYYQTRSTQGTKNQGWKDSGDAIIYDDGRIVPDPIATCEEQAFTYATKLHMAELLWWFDRKEEASALYHQASELKKRFNERFWMEDVGYFAMALDPDGRHVTSIGSDPGHCIASGIVDESLIERTAARLMAPDLFTGWGLRTLSREHVSFDPFSYHRGTVWPVEHGAFALGFYRYGLHHWVQALCRAQFEASELFDFCRLPECFSGHQRDRQRPFPAIYLKTNWPQAWTSSAMFSMLQAMLGVYAYAPLGLLLVDPHLPEWLPDITLHGIRVGEGSADVRFHRRPDGHSEYDVLGKRGGVRVVRQPSPWSMTADFKERLRDLAGSFVPGK